MVFLNKHLINNLLKLQTAIDNDLNYLVFWRNDLQDVRNWLMTQNLL